MNNTNRRRSVSLNSVPFIQTDPSPTNSSLYFKSKSSFLSRFSHKPSNSTLIIPSKSISSVTTHKRKPMTSISTQYTTGRKKYESVLGLKSEDIVPSESYISKKSYQMSNGKFSSLFSRKKSTSQPKPDLKEKIEIADPAPLDWPAPSIYSADLKEPLSEESESDDDLSIEERGQKIESRLLKRLSGGHFGSAGGLVSSINKQQRRKSKPPPEDVVLSMMKWQKRHSDPPASIELSPTEEEDEEEDAIATDHPKECAARLWHEDDSFVEREHIAEWLGQSKSLNIDTLQEYMAYFDFTKMRLDNAFRKVCSKLYFRAEAQQIDRILEAFAKRYWQCNPKSIFGSTDIVYAVVYSLLLLNTDLHVAQGNYTRMTRQEFVRNTMSTLRDQKNVELKESWESQIETYLKDMYISVKNNQILQPMQHQDLNESNFDSNSNKRLSMIGSKRMIDIKRSFNTMMNKSGSGRESMLFVDEVSNVPRKSTSSNHWQNLPTPRESFHSSHSNFHNNTLPRSFTLLTPTHSMESSPSSRPPYFKEGIVMRKHLLDSKNQKAKHREWRECLLIVNQGSVKMYGLPNEPYEVSPGTSKLNLLKSTGTNLAHLTDSLSKNNSPDLSPLDQESQTKWTGYTQLMGTIDLNHTLSNALPPPGYNRSRPFVFALQEANGGVYLIQSTSVEQMNEWVETCNYWAARQSKEPLQGGVGNLEYGWGECLNDVILDLDAVENNRKVTGKCLHEPDVIHISVWAPAAPTMISSPLDERSQLENLQKYVDQLNKEINDHREIKKKILVKFQTKSHNQTKVLLNWEAKSTYMLHEIIKYQNYCNALEKSIARQEKETEC